MRKLTHALCPAGSLVWASDPARPAGFSPTTWTELGLTLIKTSNIVVVFRVYFVLYFVFLYCKNTNIVFRILGFRRNVTNIRIYQKNVFL
jgi:hypothetical protein